MSPKDRAGKNDGGDATSVESEASAVESEADGLARLRQRAEAAVAASAKSPDGRAGSMSWAAAVQELRVYEIELEMQNDELRETQLELQRSLEHFKSLFDDAPVGYITVDDTNHIAAANRTLCTMLGRSCAELLGHRLNEFVYPEDQDTLHLHRGGPQRRLNCEVRLVRADGPPLWVELTGGRTQDGTTEPRRPRFRYGVSDISALKDAQTEREELAAQLYRSMKRRSIEGLASGLAGDFENLVEAMRMRAESAKTQIHGSSAAGSDLEEIESLCDLANELTEQLLVVAGQKQSLAETLDISEFVIGIVAHLKQATEQHVKIAFDLGANLPRISMDEAQLTRVVTSLVMNAGEAYEREEGTVRVITHERHLDRAQLQKAELADGLLAGNYICLQVTDEAVGMDAQTKDRMFDPFFTTKRSGGLGSAALLAVVRGHGGGVYVDTEPGRGTTVEVFFPIAANLQPRSDEEQDKRSVATMNTVLVIETDPSVRQGMERVMASLGLTVLLASDGIEGLELFREHGHVIDLVMMDASIPVLGWRTTLADLRTKRPDVPVVIMSGGIAAGSFEQTLGGPTSVLEKPFDHQALVHAVRSVVRRSRLH
ncbi:MAG: two-component system cell cycle sensor histidine kinase/response regulator CckA [Polyangiales bacterium]|jgi:two-component system cell cycle sensor histidine kinase/response regulator CckA